MGEKKDSCNYNGRMPFCHSGGTVQLRPCRGPGEGAERGKVIPELGRDHVMGLRPLVTDTP